MMSRRRPVVAILLASALLAGLVHATSGAPMESQSPADREAAQEAVIGSLQAARAAQSEPQQEESYQRVYEAFTRLVQSVSNNSLGNARRLVTRLNQLVGGTESAASGPAKPASATTATAAPAPAAEPAKRQQQQQSSEEQKTEQILQRLDQVNKQTDQNTLRQLQEDVDRLVGSLSDSYLRNVRRVIERVNKTLGGSSSAAPNQAGVLHQSGDRYDQLGPDGTRQPGFPGWDELIVAVDRMQKSLANFVRSSTKLITAGR
jgi:pyruvate/2-oxoglutarate dehydrogenase complex dihydrolipoamide acyltransferase (E2) component